jgi:DNA repair exonuclease SbcCD ATPase subunit
MAGETPSEFRFNGDDQEPESYYREELKDLRIEKLSQRVTLLTILLPCLIAVAIYFSYQNLSGKVSQSQDTDSLEIQRLAKEVEDLSKNFNEKLITFSTTLSNQDKDFGASIEGRIFALNKDFGKLQHDLKTLNEDLKRDLKQNQDTIEKLKASKADKKSLAVAVEQIDSSIEPLKKELEKIKDLRQDLKTVSAASAKLESKLTTELETLTAASRQQSKNHDELAASLTELSNKASDIEALALDVLILKKNMSNQIKAVTDINRRLDALQSEIDGILKISTGQKQSLKKISKTAASQQSGAAPKTATGSAALGEQPETITEKDLIE